MNFIYGNGGNPRLNQALCDFVSERVFRGVNDFSPCGSLGICQGTVIIAAVIFNNWQPDYGIIEISAAADSPKWLSKRTIREIMGIAFDQHRCQQLVSRTATDNDRATQIFKFLKFRRLLLPNMRGSGKDEYLFMLTSEEWRANKLSEVKDGKIQPESA